LIHGRLEHGLGSHPILCRLGGLNSYHAGGDAGQMEIHRPMRTAFAIVVTLSLILSGDGFAQSSASRLVLVTEQEAKLPPATPSDFTSRAGITRGPKIQLVSPAGGASVKAPLHLQLKFQSFGGAKIDLASVSIMYLKNPTVDLTERLRAAIRAGGIDVDAVELPPGIHDIRVGLKDSAGRSGSANFTLEVSQ